MSLTENQLLWKKGKISASVLPAIFNRHPYITSMDLFLELRGMLNPQKATEAMDTGNDLEDGVCRWASRTLGKMDRIKGLGYSANDCPLIAHPDRIVRKDGSVFEAKTVRFKNLDNEDIPQDFMIQVFGQLICKPDAPMGYCGVLTGGFNKVLYTVERDKDFEDELKEGVRLFDRMVKENIAPDDSYAHYDVIKRVKQRKGKVIQLSLKPEEVGELIELQSVTEARLMYEKREKILKAKYLTKLGDAEIAEIPGVGEISYIGYPSKGYEVKAGIKKRFGLKLQGERQ